MCDFEIVGPFREKRLCGNPNRWIVEYITPDDGKAMRRRVTAARCFWHADAKFFPHGSSGFTTLAWTKDPVRSTTSRSRVSDNG